MVENYHKLPTFINCIFKVITFVQSNQATNSRRTSSNKFTKNIWVTLKQYISMPRYLYSEIIISLTHPYKCISASVSPLDASSPSLVPCCDSSDYDPISKCFKVYLSLCDSLILKKAILQVCLEVSLNVRVLYNGPWWWTICLVNTPLCESSLSS